MKSDINANLSPSFKDGLNFRVAQAQNALDRAINEVTRALKDGVDVATREALAREVRSAKEDLRGAKAAQYAGNRFPPIARASNAESA